MAYSSPCLYFKQYRLIANWTPRIKLEWNKKKCLSSLLYVISCRRFGPKPSDDTEINFNLWRWEYTAVNQTTVLLLRKYVPKVSGSASHHFCADLSLAMCQEMTIRLRVNPSVSNWAIIWNNAGILLIWPSGTNCNEMLIEIQTFPFPKMHLKMPSAKWRPFCLGFNVLISERRVSLKIGNASRWTRKDYLSLKMRTENKQFPWCIPPVIYALFIQFHEEAASPRNSLINAWQSTIPSSANVNCKTWTEPSTQIRNVIKYHTTRCIQSKPSDMVIDNNNIFPVS